MKRQKKELKQAKKRIAELNRIFKRIYEDDINGTISHERSIKHSGSKIICSDRDLLARLMNFDKEIGAP